ncbi:acyltransferase [Streptomyces sp. PVA_94-07]|uniref:acyltransferase n=1 Tax=Streptomyces sp. PVA_94-07 TaxID=1225337 RepID=UPI000A9F7473|nr:acyltransferase [Streptomyces sp. PVA_94-07]
MMSTEETLRLTVAALMQLTRERQPDVAAAIGLTQPQLSRRQSGKSSWTLTDCDRLAAHWGMPTLDLLAGPTHAAGCLPAARRPTVGTQTAMPLDPPAPAPPAPRRAAPTAAPAPAETAPAPAPAPAAAAPSSAPRTPRRAAPAGPLPDLIRDRVAAALTEAGGDADAAQAALIKSAVPDVMALFAASRVGGRYEHSEFPPTADILRKRSQKASDLIWEGRPKWRNRDLYRAAQAGHIRLEVTALDMNAAYLAAMKAWLPIGKLVHSEGDHHDPKRSGVHLVDPGEWTSPDLPSPLGSRQEPGPLWITEPTLRLFFRCAKMDLCDRPRIFESWTSGASEGLLEKMRRAIVTVRDEAIANGDEVTTEYIKSMYSKFVSTIGESAANREIRRPDWMHIIRSQAFVNLWLKAHKAHDAGLTVVGMSGTDELHVSGDWRKVFPEGRGLSQVKAKSIYTLGGNE